MYEKNKISRKPTKLKLMSQYRSCLRKKIINDTGVITEKTEITSEIKKLSLLNFGNIK